MGAWMRGPLRSMFEEYVLSKDALMGLEVNREVMRKHFEEHLNWYNGLQLGLMDLFKPGYMGRYTQRKGA